MLNSRYRRNLAITAGLALLAGCLIITVFFVVLVTQFAASALEPQRKEIDQTPDVATYHNVTFTTEDAITLTGWYIPTTNGAAIILAHGYGWNRANLLPEAEFLADAGYGVLLFDFRGHGTSDSAMVTLGDHERRDLIAALDFVTAQPDVDPDRIGGIGFSMGAATLALAAAQDDRLRAVVLEAPFPTLEAVINDQAGLLGPLTQIPTLWTIRRKGVDIDAVRPVDALCNISPRPVLLIYGDQDDTIPPRTVQTMFDAACDPAETWLIPGAGHQNYTEIVPDAYQKRILNFFAEALIR